MNIQGVPVDILLRQIYFQQEMSLTINERKNIIAGLSTPEKKT